MLSCILSFSKISFLKRKLCESSRLPQTVDAGHVQFEGDLAKWQKEDRESKAMVSVFNGLYQLGLSYKTDLQVGYELYTIQPEESEDKSGHGSLTVRVKQNFWGNDGNTKTALGIIPYISFASAKPFNSEEKIQYGLGIPFSCSINERFSWGLQSQVDFIPDENENYDFSFFFKQPFLEEA